VTFNSYGTPFVFCILFLFPTHLLNFHITELWLRKNINGPCGILHRGLHFARRGLKFTLPTSQVFWAGFSMDFLLAKKKVEGARKMENLWNCCNRKSLLARILSGNMSPWKKKTLHVKQSVSVFESCLSLVAVILGHLPALGIIFPYFNDLHWSRPSRPDNISIIKASPSTQRRLNWGLTKGQ